MRFKTTIIIILRLLLAAVFIFSGFVKAVDPWGTAIKLGEYFQAFGVGWLDWSKFGVSVLQSTCEMLLGFMLLFRLKEKPASLLVMIAMAFFTILTFVIAVWNPVADCGCFGDAVKLTNWQTFFKNLILLPCSVILWLAARKAPLKKVHPMVEGSMIFMFTLFSAGVGIYSMRHLPVMDFLPFKVGVNIPQAMEDTQEGETEVTVIYKDRTTGKNHEFTLEDTEWYDSLRWEFVDTKIAEKLESKPAPITDFSVFRRNEDITPQILYTMQEQFLITLTDPAKLTEKCRERLRNVVLYAQKNNYWVACITSSSFGQDIFRIADDARIPVYNIDGTTLKMLVRANEGLVIIRNGTIVGKWNCRDIPAFNENSDPSVSAFLAEHSAARNEMCTVYVMLGILATVYVLWIFYRRKYSE